MRRHARDGGAATTARAREPTLRADDVPPHSAETPHVRVLLIEDNPGDARLVKKALANNPLGRFDLEWVGSLSEGCRRLSQGNVDVLLLDLSLPDSHGIGTLQALRSTAQDVPIVVLTGLDDDALGFQAVEQHAQDFLVKGRFGSDLLGRALCYAIGRSRAQRELQKMRSDFVAMLSHDVRSPLTAVLASVSLLRATAPKGSDDFARTLDQIEAGARSALALTGTFVDTVRIESGPLDLELKPTSLNEIVGEVLRRHESIARLGAVSFEAVLAADLPRLRLDRRLFERVVANLVSNALRFSPKESTIRVETCRRQDGVSLSVRDHGPGIAPADRAKLFQRFGLLPGARRDSNGLGLFIVRTIVEAHGGTVSVDCPAEGGSLFTLSLEESTVAA